MRDLDNAVGFELDVITVALLGGINVFGGRGNLAGVFWALALVAVLRNVLGLSQIGGDAQGIVIGLPEISGHSGGHRSSIVKRSVVLSAPDRAAENPLGSREVTSIDANVAFEKRVVGLLEPARQEGGRSGDLQDLCREPVAVGARKLQAHDQVFDVVWSGNRKPGKDGKVPAVGNTVDLTKATYTNSIGSQELMGTWTDKPFDPKQPALYYVRVLLIPTPRWIVMPDDVIDDAEIVSEEMMLS